MFKLSVLKNIYNVQTVKTAETFEEFYQNYISKIGSLLKDSADGDQVVFDLIAKSGYDITVKFYDWDIDEIHCNIEHAKALVTITEDDKVIMLVNENALRDAEPGFVEHELVHVQQYLCGDATISENGNMSWKGVEYLPKFYNSIGEAMLHQHTLPWERPAYAESLRVYGGVPTPDFFRGCTEEEAQGITDSYVCIWKEYISEEVTYLNI